MYRIAVAAAALACLSLSSFAFAAQIIPKAVEYTNDTIEQGDQLQACIVTTAIINPPAPETVNFQFMSVMGSTAFKVTAGDMDWSKQSIVAKRISEAHFYTGQFNHPTAFKANITDEGQLVAVLIDRSLIRPFLDAFFGGHYVIKFKRTDLPDDHYYQIDQAPGGNVADAFINCLRIMTGR